MQGVFNPNIPLFAQNSAEDLHFSAFHFLCTTAITLLQYSNTCSNRRIVICECIKQIYKFNSVVYQSNTMIH